MVRVELELLGSPSAYGLEKLKSALNARQIPWRQGQNKLILSAKQCIAYGGPQDPAVRDLLASVSTTPPRESESLCIKLVPRGEAITLALYGSDERGLAYALYEVARAIELEGTAAAPLKGIEEAIEHPDLTIRSVIRTMMNRDLDAEWLNSTDFWASYLDMLVATRHNRLKLSIGWRSAYFSPPYPFLIEVPGYSGVSVTNLSPQERDWNLTALQMVSTMAKDRGLEFYLDMYWMSHRPMGDWAEARKYIVDGLTEDTLPDYTRRGVRTLLEVCPNIDGLGMSGSMVENGVAQEFVYSFFDGIAECGRPMAIQIELKGVNQELVDQATRRGIHVTLGGKYCMEHKGLPYHPTQIRHEELEHPRPRGWTRNSYADMLYRPRAHDFMFNLWNWGTQKVLLWGDPDDVSRLARNSLISGSLGMEHGDPLTYKGSYSSGPSGQWRILRDRSLDPYTWEYERYWYQYLLYGRLMYNTRASPTIWRREFVHRFGRRAADHLVEALAYASRTTPLMTMVHAPSASDNAYWPEVYTNIPITMPDPDPLRRDGGRTFDSCNPSDTAMFYRVDQYVSDYLENRLIARYDPITVKSWFSDIGSPALEELRKAEGTIANPEDAEFRAIRVDVVVQAKLALFFGHKIEAAVQFGFYREMGDFASLSGAIEAYEHALTLWRDIVSVTEGVYQPNLAFHRNAIMSGTWGDREPAIVADLAQMKLHRDNYLSQYSDCDVTFGHVPAWIQHPPHISVKTTVKGWERLVALRLHYRTDGREYYSHVDMQQDSSAAPVYAAECLIPLQSTELEYYMVAELRTGERIVHPRSAPLATVKITLGSETSPPICEHAPADTFQAGKPLRLSLDVRSSIVLRSVKLYYRHVNQSEYILEMGMERANGHFEAVIPASYTDSCYDLMYYFGVIDRMGNRVLHPGLGGDVDRPYFVLERSLQGSL